MRLSTALVACVVALLLVTSSYAAGANVVSGSAESLKVSGYAQARFTHNSDKDEDSFNIPRARLGVSGDVIEDVKFKIQADFGKGGVKMTDMYLNLTRWENADVTIGQFKVPYSPEVVGSSSKLDLIERPAISSALAPDRDIGAMLHGAVMDGRIGLSAGAWNGNGANNSSNDNDNLMYGLRVAREALADDDLKLTLGLSAYKTEDADVSLKNIGDFAGDRDALSADLKLASGPMFIKAEYHKATLDPSPVTVVETAAVGDVTVVDVGEADVDGFFVRAGYMFLEDRLQGVVEYQTMTNDLPGAHDIDGFSLGLNYFWASHNHKVQLVYARLDNGSSEDEIQAQIQIKF